MTRRRARQEERVAMAEALKDEIVTVFGGSGFLGRHVVRALAKRGYRIRPAVRRPDLAGHLQPLGMAGQILPVQANLRYPASVARALEGASAAINLVGILAPTGRQSFEAVQAGGARTVAEAVKAAGIATLVHVSAIGADANSPSAYARTKAKGEEAVKAAMPGATIFRPSIVFGPEDGFFNRFAAIARMSPILPAFGADTRFQPVFVGDVAEAIARAIDGTIAAGRVYELGGPETKTFRECLALVNRETARTRPIVGVPLGLAKTVARLTEWLPGAPVTVDQLLLLEKDNVVSAEATAEGRTLAGIGIRPTNLEAILPTYLYRFRKHGQFDARRIA